MCLVTENATRFCHWDGHWDNYTNYDRCSHLPPVTPVGEFEPNVELPTIIYYTGYTISLISLTMAVAVFVHFKWVLCGQLEQHLTLLDYLQGLEMPAEYHPCEPLCDVHHDGTLLDSHPLLPGMLKLLLCGSTDTVIGHWLGDRLITGRWMKTNKGKG